MEKIMRKSKKKGTNWKFTLFFVLVIGVLSGTMFWEVQTNKVFAADDDIYITDLNGKPVDEISINSTKQTVILQKKDGSGFDPNSDIKWVITNTDNKQVVEIVEPVNPTINDMVKRELLVLRPGKIKLTATIQEPNKGLRTANVDLVVNPTINRPNIVEAGVAGFFMATGLELESSYPLKITQLNKPVKIEFKYCPKVDSAGNVIEDVASWKTENPNIATVNEKTGEVTGISAGKTTITITSFTGNLVETFDVYVAPMVKFSDTDTYKSEVEDWSIVKGNAGSFIFNSGDKNNIQWRVTSADGSQEYISVGGNLTHDKITLSPTYNDKTNEGVMNISAKAGTYYIYMYIKDCQGLTAVPYARIKLVVQPNLPDDDVVVMNVGDTYDMLKSFNIHEDDFKDFFTAWAPVTESGINNSAVVLNKFVAKGALTGTAKYKFTDTQGKDHFITIKVIDAISIDQTLANIYVGQTIKLICNTTNNAFVDWTSSNPSIATVDSDGNVTGVTDSEEPVIITATQTINGVVKQATCTVYVNKAITGITLDPSEVTIDVDTKYTIKASFLPADLNGNLNIKWVSSDDSVAAIVDKTGKAVTIEGKKGGVAVISAINLDNAVVGTCKVTVRQAIENLTISHKELSVNLPAQNASGETYQLSATYTPSNATATELIWQSTNTTVATVNEKTGLVTAKAPGTTVIMVKPAYNPNNLSAMCTFTVNQNTTGITLDTTTKTMEVGETYRMSYTISPNTATDKSVTWTSMDSNVATVTDGLITAKGAGQTYIVARTKDGHTATCTVTVTQAATSIKLSTNDLTLRVGDIYYVDATVTPTNSSETKFTWTSQDSAVATVDSSGKVTAVGAGKTLIIVKTKKGDVQYLYITVQESATGLTLNYTKRTITINKSFTLTPIFTPDTTTNTNVTWKSSDEKVATISEKGVVKGIAGGVAVITCISEDGGFMETCIVTVNEPVSDITLNKTSVSLALGKTVTLKATVKSNTSSTQTLKWTSSNTKVATVNSKGKVTTKGVGKCVIRVSSTDGSDAYAECTIRVIRPVTSITLNKTTLQMIEGKTAKLKATVKPSNASYKTVNWSTSDENVATVDVNGNIVAVKAGSCKITATAKDNSKRTAVCYVYVTSLIPATGVTVSQKDMIMVTGATDLVSVSIQPNNTTDTIKYASDNKAVASVNSQGKVTARKPGVATITVTTSSGKTAMVNVTVVGLNTSSLTMTQYTTADLWVEEVTTGVRWRSLNSDIVSVSNGKLTAKKPGTTQIEATVKGRKLYCKVTVRAIQ